jgi:hypothetical protein
MRECAHSPPIPSDLQGDRRVKTRLHHPWVFRLIHVPGMAYAGVVGSHYR